MFEPTNANETNNRSYQSFADVPTDGGVDTVAFLEASEGVVALFGESVPHIFGAFLNPLRRAAAGGSFRARCERSAW